MEQTLRGIVDSLTSSLVNLKASKVELESLLHNHDSLPDKAIASLASEAIDLLHETKQLLEPGSLVLADHFLGMPSKHLSIRGFKSN